MSLTLTRNGGYWSVDTYESLSVAPNGEITHSFQINDVARRTASLSNQDMSALQRAVEHTRFFDLKDSYKGTDDGCTPPPTDAGTTEILVTVGARTKKVRVYDGCRAGVGESQFPIAQFWQLVATIRLFLDQPEWVSVRDAEWKKRAANRRRP